MEIIVQINADVDDDINAINLQLQEIDSHSGSQKQKYLEGSATDYEMAIQDFKAELEGRLLFLSDQRFARAVQNNIDNSTAAILESTAGEDEACMDRDMAQGIDCEPPGTQDLQRFDGTDEGKDESRVSGSTPRTGLISKPNCKDFEIPSSTIQLQLQRQQERYEDSSSSMVDCVACGDAILPTEVIRCSCDDLYCAECLKSLFVRSITDETLFPPRCCGQAIPLSFVEAKLSHDTLSDFNSAAVEFAVTNRTYCARTNCGNFIPPDNIRSGVAVCPKCGAETCTYCKMASHEGDCPEDEALMAVLTLAQAERWRRCFGCNAMVELDTGCNHMTCKCSAEFCYVCGVQWKNCTCNIWEERNLLNRAEQVVDREANHPMAVPERQRRVVQMQRELRANHECRHPGRWEKQEGYRRKGYKCEICFARHWKYILKCRHCHLLACEECRRHRV